MMRFVCWKWKPDVGYRSTFSCDTVNVLHSMIGRHYKLPWELVCVTDDPVGIDSRVRIIPLWEDHSKLASPHGPGYPSCYRRLKMFSAEAVELIGPEFVSIDLDVVIVNDITELLPMGVEFRIYGDTARNTPYNGSLIQHIAGTRRQLWEKFDPRRSPQIARKLQYIGSDQAWIGACLGPNELKFTCRDGVYSFRNEIRFARHGHLPSDARIVVMHGNVDPWTTNIQRAYPWVRQHYR